LTYTTQGTHTITWTFDDGNGNVITVDQNLIVDDVTDPDTPALADVTGECEATATAPTTTDNCAGTITGTTTDPLTYTEQGPHTITWAFDDGNGNVITVDQNVIVEDVTAPVLVGCPEMFITVECDAIPPVPVVTATDNCDGVLTPTFFTIDSNPGDEFERVYSWSVTDAAGNPASCSQTVTVQDATPPTAPTLADLTGECSVTATVPTVEDNCAGTITGTTTDPLTYTEQGTHTITWAFDDGNGNVITADQNVIVDDNTAPTIVCADDIAVDNDTDECSAYVTVPAPVVTDNCFDDNAPAGTQADPFTSLAQAGSVIGAGTFFFDIDGTQFSTFVECGWVMIASSPSTATTDLDRTTALVQQGNNVLPAAVYADASIQKIRINATSGPNLPLDVETDHPGVLANLMNDLVLSKGLQGGVNEWTGIGANRMIFSCEGGQTFNFPLNRGIFQACGNGSGLHWAPTVVEGTPYLSVDYASGTNNLNLWVQAAAPVITLTNDITGTCDASGIYPVGTTTITWTTTDAAGNSNTCTQDVTVTDAQAPAITCPADITEIATSAAGAVVTFVDPIGTDNCPGASTTMTAGLASGSTFPIGTTTVEFTVSDAANLASTSCSFEVTVSGVAPMIECPDNIVVDASAGLCETTVDYMASVTAGIPTPDVTYSITPGSVFQVGAPVEVTATATNAIGSDACTFTVTVEDNEAPIIACEDLTIELDETGNASIVSADIAGGAATGTVTLYNGVNYTGNSITLEIGIHDFPALNSTVGNDRTRSVRVNGDVYVELWNGYTPYNGQNSTLPVLTITQDNPNLNANYISSAAVFGNTAGGGSMDACGIASEVLNISSFDCDNVGDNIVELTVTDNNDNVSTCTATVTVEDNIAPATPTLANVTGECEATATAPTTTDNCVGTITGTTTAPLTYTEQGTYTIVWTFDDGNAWTT